MLLDTFIHVIDRRSIEEERIRLQGRIQRSSRMEEIGALSSGIAHNFNNILGGILGHVEMMQDSIAVSGDSTRHLVVIRKGAERARDLVRQILAFGRRREIGWRPVRMVELTRETIRLCQASLKSKIELEMTSVPSGVIVTGDAVQLQQVILNLCQNADDAMGGKGCIQVIVETGQTETKSSLMHGELASGGYLRISVVDTGIGMDAGVLDRLFEPFFTTKPDGNGLGLATVRDIVCDHRGGINVASLPGRGSRFEVWLPLSAETALLPAATRSDDGLGRGEAVMLLEPDKDRLLGDEEKLAALGYEAVGFTTAEAAIDACITRSGGFDFVVLGQLGSLAHSLEVANDLRQVLPFTPFIVATTSASGTDPGSLVAAGVSDVVRWPICLEEIAAVLSRLSSRSSRERSRRLRWSVARRSSVSAGSRCRN
jgi:nitrogen-specific signal transduction histidine kinase/CheY-like chemotaxis protein